MQLAQATLGIVAEMYAYRHDGGVYIHLSFGRVVDRLAARCARVLLCVPLRDGPPPESRDYRLQATNIELVPQPFYTSSLDAFKLVVGITRGYARVCRRADALFVRGMLPYVAHFYGLARWHRRRPCHWIVGNPIALLRSHQRSGRLKDLAALAYAWQDRRATRCGRWLTGGAFVCNGAELGQVYASPRTHVAVSSTVTDDEFFERSDTCQGPTIRLLFIGFPRPEKGLQYLIEALALIQAPRPCELLIVGAADQFQPYRDELERLAEQRGVAERVRWQGYVPYGPQMFAHLRAADILVLPTLSEGTPRVLVEARANSLPVVATNVGGIPTSVTDGHDGLLVPPKDPAALATAITRVSADGELRRALVHNGLATARRLTVDRFVEFVARLLEE